MGTAGILIIGAMLVLNSLFAAYELALASVSLGRLRLLAEQKKRGAAAALAMKTRMEASLAVVQIGITLVGAIAAATGGAGADEVISPQLEYWLNISPKMAEAIAVTLIVIPLSAVTITCGELVPKSIAIRNNEWVCLKLSHIMRAFAMVVYPAMVFLEWVTKLFVRTFERLMPLGTTSQYEIGLAELRAQTKALRIGRIIDAEQERIILGASTLNRIKVSDVMVRNEDIVILDAGASLAELFVVIHLEGYTRFPVAETAGDPQSIIGYVNLKEMIFLAKTHPEDPTIRQIVRPLVSVDPNVSIGMAFSQMMKEHVHLALVKNPDGAVLGIITLEDILEEIVGDIQDEFDRLPRFVVPFGRDWIVGGGATLGQLREAMGNAALGGTENPNITFSDWVCPGTSNRIKGGDVINAAGLRIVVRKTRRMKIMEALVSSELSRSD